MLGSVINFFFDVFYAIVHAAGIYAGFFFAKGGNLGVGFILFCFTTFMLGMLCSILFDVVGQYISMYVDFLVRRHTRIIHGMRIRKIVKRRKSANRRRKVLWRPVKRGKRGYKQSLFL